MSKQVKIAVLQRGWVAVGEHSTDGDEIVLSNASIIRRWGTKKGLGELVSGPTTTTILDKAGTVRAHKLAVVLTVDCDAAAWEGKL